MQTSAADTKAAEYISKYGLKAKAEVVKQMLDAISKSDENSRTFWRSVLDSITEKESKLYIEYAGHLDKAEFVSDLFAANLIRMADAASISADVDVRRLAHLCHLSATYILALEGALKLIVTEGDAGRSAALRLLRDGPPEWAG